MKETIFMRFLFCKIHSPFMCFCKPSAARLYTSGPLKLESGPRDVPSAVYAVCDASVKVEGLNGKDDDDAEIVVLKSCIKKAPSCPNSDAGKRVQWMDNLGKELAQIKEFESRCKLHYVFLC